MCQYGTNFEFHVNIFLLLRLQVIYLIAVENIVFNEKISGFQCMRF